jgi:hypothetical protein
MRLSIAEGPQGRRGDRKRLGHRVTTVFFRQGQYAHDAKTLASFAQPDVTVYRIGDLLAYDLGTLVGRTSRQRYAE